ncbi:Beta-galactosidase [Pseudocercospora fuligena]|uniref:Beta-galactosidase n=1 Tax=Pseudocercospora fuligena TaxID=685502 RepID=A0A8H6RAY5_9PEZI|nr:Beta-galactosidase [Pseudocercospora fuligena]
MAFLPCITWAAPSPSSTESAEAPAFTYNATHFLLHGEAYQIVGGQMDPARIPYQYWRDRLKNARAMGLNTIFPYIMWDQLEPEPGKWTFHEPQNDIATYIKTAQEEGLNVILRPGPYICGEHDFGGFPYWLTQVPGLVVRDYNEPYLNLSKIYLTKLAEQLAPLQVTKGGNILMVQVENEYGSFGNNHQYIGALRDILKGLFEVPLYTNDGSVDWTLEGGSIPGALAETDGDPVSGFKARDMYITDKSMLGPQLDGEYYTYAPDQWGTYNTHNSTERDPDAVTQFVKDIDFVLGNASASISFYMVHGGTNFGFQNGALWQNRTTVFTSSYDYSAPIDEAGRTTKLYDTMREAILKYLPKDSIPEPPPNIPLMSIPPFPLKPYTSLFNSLSSTPHISDCPVPMEALGQGYGFILYTHTSTSSYSGIISPGDRARDRVLVYINKTRIGIIDSQYQHPLNISVDLNPGDELSLLVENLGRVDYYSRGNPYEDRLRQPNKGIVGNVTIGDDLLVGWKSYTIPLKSLPSTSSPDLNMVSPSEPQFYHGTFTNPTSLQGPALDTYLSIPSGIKGQVFINGFNLGRYWIVGPQQSLYLPGTVLKEGGGVNHVVVFELEPDRMNGTMVAEGLSERKWFNNVDGDCVGCV